jgi:hypothetical protein
MPWMLSGPTAISPSITTPRKNVSSDTGVKREMSAASRVLAATRSSAVISHGVRGWTISQR